MAERYRNPQTGEMVEWDGQAWTPVPAGAAVEAPNPQVGSGWSPRATAIGRGVEEAAQSLTQKTLGAMESMGLRNLAGPARQRQADKWLESEAAYKQSPAADYGLYRMAGNALPSAIAAVLNPFKLKPLANALMAPFMGAGGAVLSQMDPWTGESPEWGMTVPRAGIGAITGGALGSIGAIPQAFNASAAHELLDTTPYKKMAKEGVGGMAPTRDWSAIPGEADKTVAELKNLRLLPQDFTLTPPQRVQTQASFRAANAANQSAKYGDYMLGLHQEQMRRIEGGWRRLASAMRPAGVSGRKFGTYLQDMWKGAYGSAVKVRNGRGLFDEAIEEFGDQRVIPVAKYRETLDKLTEKYTRDATADNDMARATLDSLREMRKTLDDAVGVKPATTAPSVDGAGTIDYTAPVAVPAQRPEIDMVSVPWVQSQLSGLATNAGFRTPAYGYVSAGKIRATAGDTYADRQLRDALLEDLQGSGPAGEKLRKARDMWSEDSKRLDELENSALGRIFKNPEIAPDKAIKQFFQKTPDEIEESIQVLNVAKPELADAIRSEFLNQLTKRAYGASKKATVDDFSTARYFDLRNQGTGIKRDLFEVLFEGSPWKAEADKLLDVTKRVMSTLPPGAKGVSGGLQGMRSDLDVSGQRAFLNMIMGGDPRSGVMFALPAMSQTLKAHLYGKAMKDPAFLKKLEGALRSSGPLGRALLGGAVAGEVTEP